MTPADLGCLYLPVLAPHWRYVSLAAVVATAAANSALRLAVSAWPVVGEA